MCGVLPADLKEELVNLLQNMLMDDGVFLPFMKRKISGLTRSAVLNISDKEREILFNGVERPRSGEDKNCITLEPGAELSFDFNEEKEIDTIRLQFDCIWRNYNTYGTFKKLSENKQRFP